MAFVERVDMISEGKLAAVIIFALIAGIIIGVFIGFLIWRANLLPLSLGTLQSTQVSLVRSIAVQ